MNQPLPDINRRLPAGPAGLGVWNAYFLAKLMLFWQGVIGFHPLENLAFAMALLVPGTPTLHPWRSVIAWSLGIALAYYDSWLPPIGRAWAQAGQLASFSPTYLAELAGRFVNVEVVAMIVVAALTYLLLARWLRFTLLVMAMLAYLSIVSSIRPPQEMNGPAVAAVAPDSQLRQFHELESARKVSLPKPTAGNVPFDVVLLHVCSLSWDDLQAMGLERHRLFSRFDILLTQFNAVASYSGPAAIRLQRAACGQQSHTQLYSPVSQDCYLVQGLQRAGFEPSLAMNHDGHFDDFLRSVQSQGGMEKTVPMSIEGIRVTQYSFDGSAIYDDAGVLDRWLATRAKQGSKRSILYYNTVSLHDGNRLSGESSGTRSLDTFKTRLTRLLDDLDGFIQSVDRSGRPTVVILVPEHGAAVRGDKMQIAGLREIPSPAITLVPVGVKISGHNARHDGKPVSVDKPSSFLALTELLARFLAKSPFDGDGFDVAAYVADLPETVFVSENEDVVLMRSGTGYKLKQGKADWIDYRIDP